MRSDNQNRERDEVADLLRAVLSLGRRLRSERSPSSVSLAGIGMLSTLRRVGPMPATRLAREENLAPQSLTRLLASLEAEACIERRRGDADRRELIIQITSHGRDVLAADMRGRQAWLERAIGDALGAGDRDVLFAAARAMLKLARYDAQRDASDGDSR